MFRRDFLRLAGAASSAAIMVAAGMSGPAMANEGGTLRFVAQADLANFDPIWGTAYVVRNAAVLVWDTLYGVDSNLQPQPQMVETGAVSDDGLVWSFKLRPGLKFHDGAPVTSRDVVASLNRWKVRDVMGQRIAEVEEGLEAIDDLSFEWRLKEPFPKMLFALGKANAPCAFIMPERIAQIDPFEQITEYIGSGPMRFVVDEWQIGALAVFEKFEDYVPREEPASWLAGGKRISFDRIEWHWIPDAATAVGALQNGEVDWLERPLPDLKPILEADPNISFGVADALGMVNGVRLNHLQPPFSDVRVRRALMMAINQEDYMTAIVGADDTLWKPMASYFTPGTPLYNEVGGDILKGPRDIDAARALIEEAGFAGHSVTLMVAQELPDNKAMGDVTADLLTRLGFNVDYVATDWGSIQARRQLKTPPSEGGWNIFQSGHSGTDTANPAAYIGLRAGGEDNAWFGWPDVPEVQDGIAEWYAATTPEEEFAAAERINQAAMDGVVFGLAGFYVTNQAWRNNLQGIVSAPLPIFWDVTKTN